MDLTSIGEFHYEPWDLREQEKRARAHEILKRDKPFMSIASPMCIAFCRLQELFNYPKTDPERVEQLISEAMEHLCFALERE